MNIRHPVYQHNASLSIEELIVSNNNHDHNWLLSYLDVFVLIIMLVLTLMALNDFNTDSPSKKQALETLSTSAITQTGFDQNKKRTKNNAHSKRVKNIPSKIGIIHKNTLFKEISDQSVNLFDKPPSPIYSHLTEVNTIKKKPTTLSIKKTNLTTDESHTKKNIIAPQSLQKQLIKTIEQLNLNDAVNVKINQGYAQLEIQDKILFKSSQSKLLNAGEIVLTKLAPLLTQSLGLIYIEGHTDNRPIKTIRFPSNWELGAARATSVLHYLLTQKLDNTRLRAITYGETQPVADNLTKEGREKNRRVSITIKISNDSH